jgi:hypothetical protein
MSHTVIATPAIRAWWCSICSCVSINLNFSIRVRRKWLGSRWVSQLLPRFRLDETPKRVQKAVAEAQAVLADPRARGDDWRRLRGLPCVARDVSGEMFGTRPDRDVIRRLSRYE